MGLGIVILCIKEAIIISLRPAIGSVVMDGRFEYIEDNVTMKLDQDSGELVEAEMWLISRNKGI